MKTAVRIRKITTLAQLRGQTIHAQREDETARSRLRPGADPGEGFAWSKAGDDGLEARDYVAALKAHKRETEAGERKGAPLALQMLVVVSPEWIKETGGLHDTANARNQALYAAAKDWAESWAGEGAVIAARLDLDEVGGGVVDLMVSPVRPEARNGAPRISTSKAIKELQKATGERNEYSAAQTSWASYAQTHLDRRLERGERKEVTQREHVSPEVYGELAEKARASVRDLERAARVREEVAQELVKAADRNRMDALRERERTQEIEKAKRERLEKEAQVKRDTLEREVKSQREALEKEMQAKRALAEAGLKNLAEVREAAARDRAEAAKELEIAKTLRDQMRSFGDSTIAAFKEHGLTWTALKEIGDAMYKLRDHLGHDNFRSIVGSENTSRYVDFLTSPFVSKMELTDKARRDDRYKKIRMEKDREI